VSAHCLLWDRDPVALPAREGHTVTELERILAKALMDLIISIDLSDDDDIDPDVVTKLLEPIAADLNHIGAEPKTALIALLTGLAEEETDPQRRMIALDFPSAIGLT